MKAQYFSLACVGFISVFSLCGFPIPKAYACNDLLGRLDPTCKGRIFNPNPDSGSTIQVEPQTPRDQITSQIRFCNKTSNETVYGAFSSFQGSSGWRSDGWYEVKPKLCKTINVGRGYQGDIYVFAQSDTSSWGKGDASFCVNKTESFSISNSDKSCNGKDYKLVKMTKITFDNRSTQTFNILD